MFLATEYTDKCKDIFHFALVHFVYSVAKKYFLLHFELMFFIIP